MLNSHYKVGELKLSVFSEMIAYIIKVLCVCVCANVIVLYTLASKVVTKQ